MKDTYYAVHSFMIDDLELRGTQLSVYALIYSFTNAGSDCYGSIEYISERVGASYSSVLRALKKLLDSNYIIKLSENNDTANSYKTNLNILNQNDVQIDCQNDSPPLSKCNTPSVKMTDNNKYIKNEIPTKHNTFIQGDRKSAMSYLGQSRVVVMTLHQYVNLLRAIGILPTFHYIRVLEKIILSKPKGARWNHYGTIIKWARQDGLVDETSEMILSN